MNVNKLTEAQIERLALLVEECGEVIQIACKVLRHGYFSDDPTREDSNCNLDLLEKELGDVYCAIALMMHAGDINPQHVANHQDHKAKRVVRWLHHQPSDLLDILSGAKR